METQFELILFFVFDYNSFISVWVYAVFHNIACNLCMHCKDGLLRSLSFQCIHSQSSFSPSFYIFPLKFCILWSLFKNFGSEILVHYFYSTLFFYSARFDSVSKCMSQVAAILCAGIRITKHSIEPDIQICFVYHAQTCTFLLLFF